ncbi:MAG: hypothetical protein HY699_25035 [Deltaproteobacteria bacterium]|nr:hypothetical protein [Deltaproteobacteria bacterium]
MSTLDEIEAAAEKLPKAQQQELLLFLVRRLREGEALPEPRLFSEEQLKAWMDEDDMLSRGTVSQ